MPALVSQHRPRAIVQREPPSSLVPEVYPQDINPVTFIWRFDKHTGSQQAFPDFCPLGVFRFGVEFQQLSLALEQRPKRFKCWCRLAGSLDGWIIGVELQAIRPENREQLPAPRQSKLASLHQRTPWKAGRPGTPQSNHLLTC